MLENSVVAQQQPIVSSQDPFLEQPLVYEVVESMQSSVNPTLTLEINLNSNDVVELMQSLVDPTLPLEIEMNISHVLFFIFYFSSQGGSPSMVPPPSPEVISFDWNHLIEPFLLSCTPY